MEDDRWDVRVGERSRPFGTRSPGRPGGRRRPGAEARGWHDGGRYDRPCRGVDGDHGRTRRRDRLRATAGVPAADPAAGHRRGHRPAVGAGRLHPGRDRVAVAAGHHRGAHPPVGPADPGRGDRPRTGGRACSGHGLPRHARAGPRRPRRRPGQLRRRGEPEPDHRGRPAAVAAHPRAAPPGSVRPARPGRTDGRERPSHRPTHGRRPGGTLRCRVRRAARAVG